MPTYATTWVDYRLESGQEFAVAVCGFTGKVRHMFLGDDPLRRMMIQHVNVEGDMCQAAQHCLALDCALNTSEREHLLHMLDMDIDEFVDNETAERLGTESTLDALLMFAHRMNEIVPEELKKQQELEPS